MNQSGGILAVVVLHIFYFEFTRFALCKFEKKCHFLPCVSPMLNVLLYVSSISTRMLIQGRLERPEPT